MWHAITLLLQVPVAIPFSRGSSSPRDWTWVSCIAGRFFKSEGIYQGIPLSLYILLHLYSINLLLPNMLNILVILLVYYHLPQLECKLHEGRASVCFVHCCNHKTQKSAWHSLHNEWMNKRTNSEHSVVFRGDPVMENGAGSFWDKYPKESTLYYLPPRSSELSFYHHYHQSLQPSSSLILWAAPIQPVNFPFYISQGQFLLLATKDS